ncbi:MAG: hypothetical protein OEZ25_00330 [Candidatus Bathyarchaeota archaeon]|nr:hypothetical protein [Candidatus Bathyarchaeota archaeon]
MDSILDVNTSEELRTFMTEPTNDVVKLMRRLKGDIMGLAASGKIGAELVETLVRADRKAGVRGRRVMVASNFSNKRGQAIKNRFENALGVDVYYGDLTDEAFIDGLPDAPNIFYMLGFKFGSSADPAKATLINCIVPGRVATKYNRSKIVNFSSGNPYPYTRPESGGSLESDVLDPKGIYGWGIVCRETAFNVSAHGHSDQKVCYYRLMYSQHLSYGVLVDLAKMIMDGEEISLEMPYVNLISQRDAIDRAIRALDLCTNPPTILNVAGPIVSVKETAIKLASYMDETPKFFGEAPETALIANDGFCVEKFGPYRDSVDDMIQAAANWVMKGGEKWGLPTLFAKVGHIY